MNGTNGHQVTISDGATLVANPNSKAGQLSLGGELLLGTNTTNTGTSTLSVNGTASLNSTSTTKTFINGNGSTPGTDFSQLTETEASRLAASWFSARAARARVTDPASR